MRECLNVQSNDSADMVLPHISSSVYHFEYTYTDSYFQFLSIHHFGLIMVVEVRWQKNAWPFHLVQPTSLVESGLGSPTRGAAILESGTRHYHLEMEHSGCFPVLLSKHNETCLQVEMEKICTIVMLLPV